MKETRKRVSSAEVKLDATARDMCTCVFQLAINQYGDLSFGDATFARIRQDVTN